MDRTKYINQLRQFTPVMVIDLEASRKWVFAHHAPGDPAGPIGPHDPRDPWGENDNL